MRPARTGELVEKIAPHALPVELLAILKADAVEQFSIFAIRARPCVALERIEIDGMA